MDDAVFDLEVRNALRKKDSRDFEAAAVLMRFV